MLGLRTPGMKVVLAVRIMIVLTSFAFKTVEFLIMTFTATLTVITGATLTDNRAPRSAGKLRTSAGVGVLKLDAATNRLFSTSTAT